MKSIYFFKAALLLWSSLSLSAVQQMTDASALAKVADKQSEEAMADPTEAAGKLKQQLLPKKEEAESDGLEDPTRLNESFRAALQHTGRTQVAPEKGAAAPVLPNISLVASVCGMHNDNAAAMLKINDKTEIVHAGDKLTRIEKNQLVEIHILELHRRHVKVKVYPSNEILILR